MHVIYICIYVFLLPAAKPETAANFSQVHVASFVFRWRFCLFRKMDEMLMKWGLAEYIPVFQGLY